MKKIESKLNGFCPGVKFCIDKTYNILNDNDKIYALGKLIHNDLVINNLEKKGLIVVNDIKEVPNNETVIFRTHGETLNNYLECEKKNIKVIDLTCGKVKRIHNLIKKNNDSIILIIGKKLHPEVIVHQSYARNSYVIEKIDDVILSKKYCDNLSIKKVFYVVQTTFNNLLFNDIYEKIKEVYSDYNIDGINTICNVTSTRQLEVISISKKSSKVLIIGDKHSSNTNELYNIAKKYCKKVYFISSEKDLDKIVFSDNDIVGIIGGASTPKELIDEIKKEKSI